LSDVNPFERYEGFHLSLGKKHNIYRKKLHKDVVQRYHIDIFPDFSEMKVDGKLIYKD
jgi:aminopeptidase